MEDKDIWRRQEFTKQLTSLWWCYGRQEKTAEQWFQTLVAYWRYLEKFDHEVIDAACSSAPLRYRDYFPTVGQLEALCSEQLKMKE